MYGPEGRGWTGWLRSGPVVLAAGAVLLATSAYNFGHGAVDVEAGDDDDTYYPNHQYIENVRALMSRF